MKADGKSPTATFIKLENNITVAVFANEEWNSEDGDVVKDSWSMLLNLTNKYNVKARDHKYGGIRCASNIGPSFGD
jgi:hypothetical protein